MQCSKYQLMLYGLLLATSCLLVIMPIRAQEAEPSTSETLHLPEVVITGIDRSKIQRMIPKVDLPSPLPIITESSWDRAEALIQEGDLRSLTQAQRAEEQYTKAIKQDPTNRTAYLRLGDVYRALNRATEAAEAYHKALDISSENLEAHYKLGILYETVLHDLQKAIYHYRLYLQLGGTDHRVKIWLRDAERQHLSGEQKIP